MPNRASGDHDSPFLNVPDPKAPGLTRPVRDVDRISATLSPARVEGRLPSPHLPAEATARPVPDGPKATRRKAAAI